MVEPDHADAQKRDQKRKHRSPHALERREQSARLVRCHVQLQCQDGNDDRHHSVAERFDTRAVGEPNCTSFPTWRDLVAEHHPAHRCPPTSMIGSANARGPSRAGYRGEAILRDAAKHLHCTMISPHRALGPPLVWTYFLATCLPRNSRISLAISSPFVSRAKWPASSRWYSNVFRSRL